MVLPRILTGSNSAEYSVIAAPNAVTEKALDDIDHGIGLSKVYKDTDENAISSRTGCWCTRSGKISFDF